MPLTGRLLRTKTLARQGGEGCLPAIVSILLPDCSDTNRLALLSTEQAWKEQAEAQPASQQERARLAVDTAWIASQSLCRPDLGPANGHYITAAQDDQGAVVGLSIFYYIAEKQLWLLALHTRDPHDQGGSPATCQIRGVGSELLGADAQLMASRVCATVELHPLDAGAARFWQSRGFRAAGDQPCSDNGACTLSCPGLRGLVAAYATTPTEDQDMLCDTLTGVYGRLDYSLHARYFAVTARR